MSGDMFCFTCLEWGREDAREQHQGLVLAFYARSTDKKLALEFSKDSQALPWIPDAQITLTSSALCLRKTEPSTTAMPKLEPRQCQAYRDSTRQLWPKGNLHTKCISVGGSSLGPKTWCFVLMREQESIGGRPPWHGAAVGRVYPVVHNWPWSKREEIRWSTRDSSPWDTQPLG